MLYATKSCWHLDINIKQLELTTMDCKYSMVFTSLIAFWASSDSWWELQVETRDSRCKNINKHQSMCQEVIWNLTIQKEKRLPTLKESQG